MQKPTILIVAGGKNSRFFPLNTETHKGFLPLMGKPMVVRALESLKKYGFNKVIIVVSKKDYDEKGFSKYLKNNNLGLNIKIVLQKKPKGMGDALLTAKDELKKYANEYFILASPYHSNLGKKAKMLWAKKEESGANCVLSGTHTENPELYGVLNLDPNNQEKVLGIIEKPKKGSFAQGTLSPIKVDSVYLFDNKFINELEDTKKEEYSLEKAITTYAKKRQGELRSKRGCPGVEITWIKNTQPVESLKYPWHLFRLFTQTINQEKNFISKSVKIAKTAIIDTTYGPVIIDSGARVGEFTKITGPCYIGKNVLVGDYSFIRGSSLERDVIVGANTEVVRSIFFENSSIHYGYIADSILGQKTTIGAGIITANKRFDRKSVRIKINGNTIESDLESLGIITGYNTQIGIRVNSMPGILIGKNATIYPGVTISENIDKNETLKK